MAFSMPSLKHQPELVDPNIKYTGEYEVPNLMLDGFTSAQSANFPHPLAASEANYMKNSHNLNMNILRNTQGLHAPLTLGMELKAAKKVGRLPFLPSSNMMYDTLTGRDIQIGPEDVFNTPDMIESMGQPHAIVERSLGLL